jgi:hypothetical protein
MSNPTNLQELADSLTASLRYAHQRQDAAPSAGDGAYQAGYAAALADTRATVLAMIAEGREVIRTVHVHIPEGAECAECGRNDVVGQVGSLFYCTRHEHEVKVTAQAELDDSMLLRWNKRPVCDECGGSGIQSGHDCPHCNGTGVLQ